MVSVSKKRAQRIARGNKAKEQATGATTAAATTANHKPVAPTKRPTIYEIIKAVVHYAATPPGAITAAQAKELLGWQEEPEDSKAKFGQKYLLEFNGKKVRCNNNVTNRPLYNSTVDLLKQEVLRKRWRFNGEPIIIGRTGLVLNGQHTLIALIMAAAEWQANPVAHPQWKQEPTLDKLIVYGVEEADEVVNTMDTCKPRSLSDVIYRAHYFKNLNSNQRKKASHICDYTIRMLWHRTATHSNAFSKHRTHSESIAFLEKHPKIMQCVQHIYEENGDKDDKNKIGKWLSVAYAAACMYMMAASKSNAEAYYTSDNPSEKLLDLSRWDRASEFFVELAGGATTLNPVRAAITKLVEDGSKSPWERMAIIAKAWNAYANNKPVTAKTVSLQFVVNEETGNRSLVESPIFGGIDVGEEGLPFAANGDPTKEDVKNGTKEVQAKRAKTANGAASTTTSAPTEAKKAGIDWAAGDVAWVHGGDEPYIATLTGDPYETVNGPRMVMVDSADGNWEVKVDDLSMAQFEKK